MNHIIKALEEIQIDLINNPKYKDIDIRKMAQIESTLINCKKEAMWLRKLLDEVE